MPRFVAKLAALLALVAVGVWAWQTVRKNGTAAPPATEVEAAPVGGVRFEIEFRPEADGERKWGADTVFVSRGREFLDYADGLLVLNGLGFPTPKPGDVVRWNLAGPLLINGEPQAPHPLQPRPIDPPATDLPWTTRGGPTPRDTLSVGWASAGRVLVAANGDGALRVWDVDRKEVRATLVPDAPKAGMPELRAAISPDGMTVATADRLGGSVTVWDVGTGKRKSTHPGRGTVNALAFAAGGRLLVARDGKLDVHAGDGDKAGEHVWGAVHTGFVPPFVISADGRTLARNDGTTITVFPLPQPLPAALPAPTATVRPVSAAAHLALSADGKLLAVFDGTSRLAIHDTATGAVAHRLRWRADREGPVPVTALAFAPDGQTLAVGTDGGVRLYDVPTGRERGWFASPHVRSLAYSADGRTLAAGLRYAPGVRLWEAAELVAK